VAPWRTTRVSETSRADRGADLESHASHGVGAHAAVPREFVEDEKPKEIRLGSGPPNPRCTAPFQASWTRVTCDVSHLTATHPEAGTTRSSEGYVSFSLE
jgi:hypothetical protein